MTSPFWPSHSAVDWPPPALRYQISNHRDGDAVTCIVSSVSTYDRWSSFSLTLLKPTNRPAGALHGHFQCNKNPPPSALNGLPTFVHYDSNPPEPTTTLCLRVCYGQYPHSRHAKFSDRSPSPICPIFISHLAYPSILVPTDYRFSWFFPPLMGKS